MKLTYFGHSAFQIETGGTTLLVDPFITGNKHAEGKVDPAGLNPDVIILTHAHGDHWGDTPEIAGRTGALVVSNFEVVQYLAAKHGHTNGHGMNTGGAYSFPWGRLKLTLAHHSSSFPDGTYGGNPNGFILEAEGKVIYNTGDTCAFYEMAWLREEYGVDLLLLPIGDNFTMGPEEAVRVVQMVRPKLTVPLHYGTFPPIEIDMERWTGSMEKAGFATKVLGAGEPLEL